MNRRRLVVVLLPVVGLGFSQSFADEIPPVFIHGQQLYRGGAGEAVLISYEQLSPGIVFPSVGKSFTIGSDGQLNFTADDISQELSGIVLQMDPDTLSVGVINLPAIQHPLINGDWIASITPTLIKEDVTAQGVAGFVTVLTNLTDPGFIKVFYPGEENPGLGFESNSPTALGRRNGEVVIESGGTPLAFGPLGSSLYETPRVLRSLFINATDGVWSVGEAREKGGGLPHAVAFGPGGFESFSLPGRSSLTNIDQGLIATGNYDGGKLLLIDLGTPGHPQIILSKDEQEIFGESMDATFFRGQHFVAYLDEQGAPQILILDLESGSPVFQAMDPLEYWRTKNPEADLNQLAPGLVVMDWLGIEAFESRFVMALGTNQGPLVLSISGASQVPEPATMMLVVCGGGILFIPGHPGRCNRGTAR